MNNDYEIEKLRSSSSTAVAIRDLAIDALKQENVRLTGLVNEYMALKDARMWEIKDLKDALTKSNANVSRLRDALTESVEYVGNLIRASGLVANEAERLTREVSHLRDTVAERDAEIDTLRAIINEGEESDL